jgi:hypothetical protein
MKIRYKQKNLGAAKLATIAQANRILDEYAALGYDLTLRQLYYQFVARDLIPNRQSEYKKLGDTIADGRLGGLIDWDRIVDRGRWLRELAHWNDPSDIVRGAAGQFRIDKWADQPYRVETWIEKDALVGVIEAPCQRNDVPFFSCRGYTSASEMWGASQRIMSHLSAGQHVRVLHLGDHDPSGLDMTRDIEERLLHFLASHAYWGDIEGTPAFAEGNDAVDWVAERFSVNRLALNMDQVEEHDPPPNPAKITDSRAERYIARHGTESWELDALPPDVLGGLIEDQILDLRDEVAWEDASERQDDHRATLRAVSENWEAVKAFLADRS